MTTDEYLHCPFCPHAEWVSEEDPDTSFGEVLRHIRSRHPGEDQTPAALWPKIEVKAG